MISSQIEPLCSHKITVIRITSSVCAEEENPLNDTVRPDEDMELRPLACIGVIVVANDAVAADKHRMIARTR